MVSITNVSMYMGYRQNYINNIQKYTEGGLRRLKFLEYPVMRNLLPVTGSSYRIANKPRTTNPS